MITCKTVEKKKIKIVDFVRNFILINGQQFN